MRKCLLSILIPLYVSTVCAGESGSIQGTLLMLDHKTLHVAIVVQVVKPVTDGRSEPTVMATTSSDENVFWIF